MNQLSENKKRFISSSDSLLNAMKLMDGLDCKLLIVGEFPKVESLLSIGDIQRAILKGIDLKSPLKKALRKRVNIAVEPVAGEIIKREMLSKREEFMPVVDENRVLTRVVTWEEISSEGDSDIILKNDLIRIPIAIMAGGMGTRLKPLTNVIPKALIPLGEKTIIEYIFEHFFSEGATTAFVIANYKSNILRDYLKSNQVEHPYKIIYETEYLGTAGGLKLIDDTDFETLFVSNCDVLIDEKLSKILKYHRDNGNAMTIVGSIKHYQIPYGSLVTGERGTLKYINEKPDFILNTNTGLYIIERKILRHIKNGEALGIPALVDRIMSNGGLIGVYPISDGAWFDIGRWDEYMRTQDRFNTWLNHRKRYFFL